MLNFAEQTGSGAVMLVWSFSLLRVNFRLINFMRKSIKTQANRKKIQNLQNTKHTGTVGILIQKSQEEVS
jgi:hypothetical protein